jgi:hypothetical protein
MTRGRSETRRGSTTRRFSPALSAGRFPALRPRPHQIWRGLFSTETPTAARWRHDPTPLGVRRRADTSSFARGYSSKNVSSNGPVQIYLPANNPEADRLARLWVPWLVAVPKLKRFAVCQPPGIGLESRGTTRLLEASSNCNPGSSMAILLYPNAVSDSHTDDGHLPAAWSLPLRILSWLEVLELDGRVIFLRLFR